MADWVHCNGCYIQPGPTRSFVLTSCGHIFCQTCLSKSSREKCQLCGSKFTTIPLTSQMRPDIEMYFTDPKELLKKYQKNLQQVMEFQHGHRSRLFAQYKNLIGLKDEYKQLNGKYIELEKHRNRLEEENEHLRCCLKQQQQNARVAPSQMSYGSQMSQANHTNVNKANANPSHFTPPANRISIRTPPVNGRLLSGLQNGYSSTSSTGSCRGLSTQKSAGTPNENNSETPMRISPSTSLRSLKLLSSGQPLCSTPNASYNTPPYSNPYLESERHSIPMTPYSRMNCTSPLNYHQIRVPMSSVSSFGLIRRATVSPYSSQENKENE